MTNQSINLPDYTVDELINKYAVEFSSNALSKEPGQILVSGIVEKINTWKNLKAFITLSGADGVITVKCPIQMAPKIGESIVIKGSLSFEYSKFSSGFQLVLTGKPEAAWTPVETEGFKKNIPLNLNKQSLQNWLSSNSLNDLALIGSSTGISDALSQCGEFSRTILRRPINVSDVDEIKKEIHGVVTNNHGVKAIAIVRGGDDISMKAWDSPEVVTFLVELGIRFYTALGHTHKVVLADQYADESFHTPTDLGASLFLSLKKIEHQRLVDEELGELRQIAQKAPLQPAKKNIIKTITIYTALLILGFIAAEIDFFTRLFNF